MTVKSSKSWRHIPHTHPADSGQAILPNSVPLTTPSRGVVFDQSGTVTVRLAGVSNELPAAIVGVSGDISALAGGVYTSTTSGKFSSIAVNDPVVITGFSHNQNNGTGFIATAVTGTQLTVKMAGSNLAPYTIPETPAGAAVTIQDQVKTSVQNTVTITVIAGVLYPISIDLWTAGSGVTTGTALW